MGGVTKILTNFAAARVAKVWEVRDFNTNGIKVVLKDGGPVLVKGN